MQRIAIFLEDTKDWHETEAVGRGEVVYLHFRPRRGLLARRRLARFLAEKAAGCTVLEAPVALPCPRLPAGDAGALVHACAARIVPSGTERLALFPGRGWQREVILEIAEKVRFLELVGGAEAEALAEEIGAETGLSVPVFPCLRPEAGKTVLRLPGAPKGCGLDLSDPCRTCTFLPPQSLRRVCRYVGTDGQTVAALMSFFGFAPWEACVFLSKSTKGIPCP